ncbi:MAG: MBL fold metallo-hydrolase [Bacilli bacterium]|nr:MBL fold metallo-hydrolase [Bacilli bacterium]MBN2696360.1 MBL fold metallo-hydrolase [Bacilli bacterium]
MKIYVLASGSGGNTTYIEMNGKRILIDAGLSYRQIISRLTEISKEFSGLDYIFLTHEHGDHTSGLVTIQKRTNAEIYLSEGTYRNLSSRIKEAINPTSFKIINFQEPMIFSGFSAMAFLTYHDALEPCGYRFSEAGKSLVYMTDTGYFPRQSFDLIRNADMYIIEANHEPDLLLDSDRPWLLKKRILDDQGHLSNEDSAFLIANVLGERTKKIILAHLSEECNTESDALQAYSTVFTNQGLVVTDYRIACARQNQPLEEIEL